MELNSINSRISSLLEQFESILKNISPNFLHLGQVLENTYSEAKTITQLTLKALQIGGDETDQSPLNDVTVFAEAFLKELKNNNAELIENLEDIKTSIDYLDKLQKAVYSIRGIAKTLNMISLNIGIESSRSARSEEIFGHFVEEIKELSNRVTLISREMCDDSKSSQIKQVEILDDIMAREHQLKKITTVADEVINANIDSLRHLYRASQHGFKKSMDHSKEISRHIGLIIESIQFEDITRQQLEHIFHAIQETEKQCSGALSSEDGQLINREILNQIHSSLVIQVAQIEQVIIEILAAHNKILNSFKEIGKLAGILTDGTSNFSMEKDIRSEIGTPFEELISGFTDLDEILKQGYELSEKVEDAVSKSIEITSRLSLHIGRVENISLDLHIKAINAVLMSERLGNEGMAHAVLARNVTEVSKESNNFVSEIVEIIECISKLTDGLKKTSEKGDKGNLLQQENNKCDLTSFLDEISGVYEQFREVSSSAFEHSGILGKSISQVDSAVSFLGQTADSLSQCNENLKSIIKSLEPYQDQIPAKGIGDAQVSQEYTMKIERDVHKRTVEETDQLPLAPVGGENEQCNEFGDNIELF